MEGKRKPFGKLEIDLQKKTNLCLDQAFFLGGGALFDHTPTLKTRE